MRRATSFRWARERSAGNKAVITKNLEIVDKTDEYELMDGVTRAVNPYQQGALAKELGISILDGRKLF